MEKRMADARENESILKRTWALLAIAFQSPFTWVDTWLVLNIIIISNIIWPAEALHVEEMGILAGTAILSEGTFALLFGLLADRYSRKRILVVATILHGVLFAIFGFLPEGLGHVSFFLFFGLNLAKSALFGYQQPVEASFIDDAVDEKKRSQYYGMAVLLSRLGYIAGAITVTGIFKAGWQYYFFIIGGAIITTGIVIEFKVEEPKRGTMREELKSILNINEADYTYRLTAETLKSTVFSKTNLIAMIEGIFSNFIFSFPMFLLFACYESPPYNMEPVMKAWEM